MTRFKLDKGAEVSGVFASGETWSVKPDSNGNLDAKDAQIVAVLERLAADPDQAVERAKG